jgi:hypothetical protein
MGAGFHRVLGFHHPVLRSLQCGAGRVERLLALIDDFLGLDTLLQKCGSAVQFLLGQQEQAVLLNDIRIGFVDRLLSRYLDSICSAQQIELWPSRHFFN